MTVTLTPRMIDEIEVALRERGRLTKEELLEVWPVSEDEYRFLREKLLARRGIRSGGRKRGGFVVGSHGGPLPDEDDSDPLRLRSEWERSAVERLCDLLRHDELEALLGTLLHTIRQVRRHRTGEDRRGTKRELATALVLQHGQDLLRDTEVRRAVGRATGVRPPGRWHPGKAAAMTFAYETGFPPDLGGVTSHEVRPNFEMLEGRVELSPLWDFQREVQRRLLEKLYEPGDRGLVTLPTGAGKTRVAVESVRYWLADRYDVGDGLSRRGLALWLAHTEELCEQAYACFRQVWESDVQRSPLLLVRFWGGYTRTREAVGEVVQQSSLVPSVLVSTPHRIVNMIRGSVEWGPDAMLSLAAATGLIIVDEAHRAAARSYREILDTLTELGHPVSVVGLTATPFRKEYVQDDPHGGTRELREIFAELIEPAETLGPDPHPRLQEMGVLSRPRFEVLETHTTLHLPGYEEGEVVDAGSIEQLDRVMAVHTDRSSRRILVQERIRRLLAGEDASILYFGPSVRDAECMAYMLRADGISSAVVTGATHDAIRKEAITEFRAGRVRVLCNCEVLTTGFDAPRVSHVVMARPTVSQVLYEQMVGRGLRGPRFGGTERCTIVDCRDDFRGPRPELGYEAFRRVWGGRGG